MDPLCLRGGRGKKNIAREPPLKDGCILHGGLWTPQGGRGPPDEKKRVEEKRRGNKTARTGDAEADAADERRVGGHVTQVGAGIGEARRSQQQRPAVGVGEFDAGAAAVDAVARLAHRQQLQVVRPLAHPRHLGPASKNGDSSKKKKYGSTARCKRAPFFSTRKWRSMEWKNRLDGAGKWPIIFGGRNDTRG